MTRPATLSDLAPSGALAVIAPHPDDETLGCGGLLALAAREGRRAVVVLLTDGAASHPHSRLSPPATMARIRAGEIRRALTTLGHDAASLIAFGMPDGRLAQVDSASVVSRLAAVLDSRGVGAVFVTGPDDPHPDHRRAHALAAEAAGAAGATLWTYPVRAHARPAPPYRGWVRLPIDAVLPLKAAALRRHASQWPGGVPDDPGGFHLTDEDLAFHLSGEELYAPADPLQTGEASRSARR